VDQILTNSSISVKNGFKLFVNSGKYS
jgi:hypothetical protein